MDDPAKSYAFVDGGYIRHHYSEAMRAFFGAVPPLLISQLRSRFAFRKLFYYDCEDETPRTRETSEQAAGRMTAFRAHLDRIRATEGCHVRLGTMKGSPKRRQKQVDVLLAVEMLTHAFRNNIENVLLVAGDLDFKPAVDSLVSLGKFVRIGYIEGHAAAELLDAADARLKLGLRVLHSLTPPAFQTVHPLPNGVLRPNVLESTPHSPLARGWSNGKALRLVQTAEGFMVVVEKQHEQGDLCVPYHDREKLVRFFEDEHGPISYE